MPRRQKMLLTEQGFKELQKEYDTLTKVRRPELVLRIAQAREAGDLAENSEYAAARDDLAFVDERIVEIEEVLKGAKTIGLVHPGKNGKVEVGCKVRLHVGSKQVTFHIVGEWEADPKEQKISHSSPLGKALLGKKEGDIVVVDAPAGRIEYKVIHIE